MNQYRITINGSQSQITNEPQSDRWEQICEFVGDRGGEAKYESRFVTTDKDFIETLTDRTGWKIVGKNVIGPWTTIATLSE